MNVIKKEKKIVHWTRLLSSKKHAARRLSTPGSLSPKSTEKSSSDYFFPLSFFFSSS